MIVYNDVDITVQFILQQNRRAKDTRVDSWADLDKIQAGFIIWLFLPKVRAPLHYLIR